RANPVKVVGSDDDPRDALIRTGRYPEALHQRGAWMVLGFSEDRGQGRERRPVPASERFRKPFGRRRWCRRRAEKGRSGGASRRSIAKPAFTWRKARRLSLEQHRPKLVGP